MKGLVLVFTGEGKGKTTAALGMCLRFLGWGKKVCVIQFLKSPDFVCGEKTFFKQNGIALYSMGIGYSWTGSEQEQLESAEAAWKLACEKIQGGKYDFVVLDELCCVLSDKNRKFSSVLAAEEVIEALKKRPPHVSVAVTGRGAPELLRRYADTVTEMKQIKHAYEKGVAAQEGIEF